jgi:hypothetical protein
MVIEDAVNSKANFVDLVKLIRSLQRVEGNPDCYRSSLKSCNRTDCAWRDHCLKAPEGPSKAGGESQGPKKAANPKQEQDSLH